MPEPAHDARPRSFACRADGDFDYQLGGGYAPPQGVVTVARDRTDTPAPRLYTSAT